MLSIAVTALANVIGLAAAALALILLSRADGNGRTGLRSRWGLGLLSLFVAGCLLGVGGQFMLSRLLSYAPASRAEAQARLQMALQEPLEALTVQVHGPDPFRNRPDACSLRLIAVTRLNQRLISELPRARLLSPENDGPKVPATTMRDFREYIISWQSIIEGATSQEGRAVATRIGHLNDWRRFDHFEAEIVSRAAKSIPMPDSLRIAARADQPLELLNGRKTSEKAEQHGDVWVCAYHDHPPWLSQTDRITGWKAEEAYRSPHRGLDFILMILVAAGSSLLVVGVGLLVLNRNPDAEEDSRPQATSSPEQASPSIALVETRVTGTDSPADPEHNVPPSWVPAWSAPAFVWGVWTLMLLTNLTFIGKYADSVPFCEDWYNIVPYLTSEKQITIDYLWAQEVEHRYPLPKVVLLTLLKLSGGDFRAPHFFKIFAMGGLAFAMIRVASNVRGWTSYTDAFFPIALLHAGFASYTPGAWESTVYLVPAIVAVPILIIAVQKGTQITLGTGMLAGICLALLPLCSAAGLLYLPLLTLWLGYSAVMSWRSPELHSKRASLVILGWLLTALLLALLYFYGYDRGQANSYVPANAGVWAICKTSLAFLAASLGEMAKWTFPFSGMVLLALSVLSAGILILAAWRGKGLNRGRALGILCFMGASSVLALGLGWGRAGFGYKYGFFFPIFSVPILCCIYFAWGFSTSSRISHFAQACLLICLCFAIWGNILPGITRAREKHALREAFKRDLQQKSPPYMLITRHRRTLGMYGIDGTHPLDLAGNYLRMMRRAGFGFFRDLEDDPAFRVRPLSLEPIETNEVKWEEGIAYGTAGKSYITFELPRTMFVAAIRICCSTPQDGPVEFGVAWKRRSDSSFAIPLPQFTGTPQSSSTFTCCWWPYKRQTIVVADRIDQIRIYPNVNPGFHPFAFYPTRIEALIPESQEVHVGLVCSPKSGPAEMGVLW